MPMGMAPPPGGPPPMQGGPPPGGVNEMVAGDMAGRMGQGPGGGDVAGQLTQLLQQAVLVTVQVGPEEAVMQGLPEIWKGAFGALAQKIGSGSPGGGAPQGAGMPGAGIAPPPGGGMPMPGPQMSGPMGR